MDGKDVQVKKRVKLTQQRCHRNRNGANKGDNND